MTAQHITDTPLAAQGGGQLENTINGFGVTLTSIGIAIIGVVVVAVAISIAVGAFGEGGKLRKHIQSVAIVAFACFVLGGGAIFTGAFTDLGRTTAQNGKSGQISQQTGGVN